MMLFFVLLGTVHSKDPKTTLLAEWPMIMVHDAATTYLEGGVVHPVNNWAKTQVRSILILKNKCEPSYIHTPARRSPSLLL
jgi:hypothetical protein